jgi:glycosyltransferase involved in cell wall biosynthesis
VSKIPRVSVVVPSFNEPVAILEESLSSLMNQTFGDFECIVVDESSQPELAHACKSICGRDARFRYVHPPQRLGLSGSLNLGISMARGELIARFDSDDVCLPERLQAQITFLDENPEVGVVGAAVEIIDENGSSKGVRHYPQLFLEIVRKLHFTTSLAHPTVIYRASIPRRYGAYDPFFRYSEDLDMWLRWLNNGVVFANLPDILVKYRQARTQRHRDHWKFNLRARFRNFAPSFMVRRLTGIICIGIWSFLPKVVQEAFFRLLLIRARQ